MADDEEIIVEGRRLTRKEVRAQAYRVINALGALSSSDQLMRWHQPLCPTALHLREEQARIFTDRIRRLAKEVGAPVGKQGCTPNIVIAFSDDAGALYLKASARSGFLLHSEIVTPQEHRALSSDGLPIRWWYQRRTETAAGTPVLLSPSGMGAVMVVGGGGSQIRLHTRVALQEVRVVVDVRHAEGFPLKSLASYIAMVSLAGQRLPTPPLAVPSITNLFADDAASTSDLSEWDYAYLKALYATPANLPSAMQRNAMAGKLADWLATK